MVAVRQEDNNLESSVVHVIQELEFARNLDLYGYTNILSQVRPFADDTALYLTFSYLKRRHTREKEIYLKKKVKVGNDQEMVQSERNSHSKNRDEKK